MKDIILLKYGEVVLKGLNRSYFDSLLKKRIKSLLKQVQGEFDCTYAQSVMAIRGCQNADMDKAYRQMKKVFGIVSVCRGYECEKDMDAIEKVLISKGEELLAGAKTFRCTAKRSDKKFPLGSPEICALGGQIILENFPHMKVDITNPQATVFIEIRDHSAIIHGGGEKGAGGMPTGSNGTAVLLLSGGIDSPVAGYMAAKRGVMIEAVYFESPPYTGEGAKEKVISLATKLSEYCGQIRLHIISVTQIQQEIMKHCENKLFTLLLRRFMMRLAQRTAIETGGEALITGESVGQVASQTILSLAVTAAAVNLPILQPCIGLDKEEIVERARKIETFDISGLPYEDCCSLFTPKHPNTRPKIEDILAEEAKLDIEALEEQAFGDRTCVNVFTKGII